MSKVTTTKPISAFVRARIAEATPRPWHVANVSGGYYAIQNSHGVEVADVTPIDQAKEDYGYGNAKLITTAVNAYNPRKDAVLEAMAQANEKALTCASLSSDVRALIVSANALYKQLKDGPDIVSGDIIVDDHRGLGPRWMPHGLNHEDEK